MIKSIELEISGMGLVFYSPLFGSRIAEGEDYFSLNFEDPIKVNEQALLGEIVGINLGSPGRFILNIFSGYPPEQRLIESDFKLRAGINICGGAICVRDLYDLMDWYADLSISQTAEMKDGFYHMTFLTWTPESGTLGDEQIVELYLQELSEMPKLKFDGVPSLF